MKIPVLLAIGVFCLAQSAWGVNEYYQLSRSVRALGMGGAVYALSDDEASLFFNPAGLSLYPGGLQVMLSTQAHVGDATLSAIDTLSSVTKRGQSVSQIVDAITSLQGK